MNEEGHKTEVESPRSIVANALGGVTLAPTATESASQPLDPNPIEATCDVCKEQPRLYKCPRCSVFSCSLDCCKRHKVAGGCSGRRDRTAFVPVSAYAEASLRNDFHFLEDILQNKDSAKRTMQVACGGLRKPGQDGQQQEGANGRNKRRKGSHSSSSSRATSAAVLDDEKEGFNIPLVVAATAGSAMQVQSLDGHPPAVQKLVVAARERRVNLVVMPGGMSRRAANTSRFDQKAGVVYWKLNCVFVASRAPFSPSMLLNTQLECRQEGAVAVAAIATATATAAQASSSSAGPATSSSALVGMTANNMHEARTVSEVLSYFVDPVGLGPEGERGRPSGSNAAQCHALRYIRLARERVNVFVQRIPSSAQQPLFCQLDMQDTIRTALAGQTVIEFPTLFFGLEEDMRDLRRHVQVVETSDAGLEPGSERGEAEAADAVIAPPADNDGSDSASEDEEDFMQALREMRGKEVSALKRIIREGEGEGEGEA